MMMRDPWFWLWMGPLIMACFAVLGAAGYTLVWLMLNPPWREPAASRPQRRLRNGDPYDQEAARERARAAFHAAMASGNSPGAAPLLAELERGWAREGEERSKVCVFCRNAGRPQGEHWTAQCPDRTERK